VRPSHLSSRGAARVVAHIGRPRGRLLEWRAKPATLVDRIEAATWRILGEARLGEGLGRGAALSADQAVALARST
jgi:hypothetical protein